MEDSDSATSYTSTFLPSPDSSFYPDDKELPSPALSPMHSISLHPKNSLSATIVSYVCVTVGAGIISLPLAVAEAGWFGVFLVALTSVICVQTANWLIECMHPSPNVTLCTYEDIGVAAMGRAGKIIVAVVLNITLFGVCCIFLIIAGGNLFSLTSLSLHVWVFILGAVLIPISWLKTVKEIRPLAFFGLFASLLVGGVVILKGLQTYATSSSPSTVTHSLLRLSGLSTCTNIVVFALGAHSVIPNQVNEMQHARRDYKKFTAYAYILIACVYCTVAACGYAGYGESVQDNVLISIDSPTADHKTHVLTQIARLFISLHVIVAYPLPLNPVSLFVEEQLGVLALSPSAQLLPRLVLRSTLVLSTVFIASVVPYFGSILSLVSALSVIATAFVLPPIFYYLLFRAQREFGYVEMGKLVVILALGLLSLVIGLYYAVTGLVDDIRTNPNPFDHYFG